MRLFEREIDRLKKTCYANRAQLNTVVEIRRFIHDNYCSEISLERLSRLHFVSKYHLLRLFKQYYGMTIRQYVIDVRIAKAKEFLGSGMSVTQTCFAIGYASPSTFIALFKTKTGLTPTAFKKQQLSISATDGNG